MDLSAAPIFAPGTKVVKENCDSSAVYASAANTQDDAQCRSISGSVLVGRSAASGKIKRLVRKKLRKDADYIGPTTVGSSGASGTYLSSTSKRSPGD